MDGENELERRGDFLMESSIISIWGLLTATKAFFARVGMLVDEEDDRELLTEVGVEILEVGVDIEEEGEENEDDWKGEEALLIMVEDEDENTEGLLSEWSENLDTKGEVEREDKFEFELDIGSKEDDTEEFEEVEGKEELI